MKSPMKSSLLLHPHNRTSLGRRGLWLKHSPNSSKQVRLLSLYRLSIPLRCLICGLFRNICSYILSKTVFFVKYLFHGRFERCLLLLRSRCYRSMDPLFILRDKLSCILNEGILIIRYWLLHHNHSKIHKRLLIERNQIPRFCPNLIHKLWWGFIHFAQHWTSSTQRKWLRNWS